MQSVLAMLVLCSALLPAALFAQQAPLLTEYTAPKETTVLTTTSVDWDSILPHDTEYGQRRDVFDNPTTTLDKLEVHITTLNPGKESQSPHYHAWEEIMLIKDGTFDISINGKIQRAVPGDVVFLASNASHNAKNVGATPASYYVINFISDLANSSEAKSATEQTLPGKMASTIIHTDSMTRIPSRRGWQIMVYNSPTRTIESLESHITTLNPGQQTAVDMVDSNDEVVIVKSGDVECLVNGVASRMHAGAIMFWSPMVKRTLRNLGPVPTTYEVFRATTARSIHPTIPPQQPAPPSSQQPAQPR